MTRIRNDADRPERGCAGREELISGSLARVRWTAPRIGATVPAMERPVAGRCPRGWTRSWSRTALPGLCAAAALVLACPRAIGLDLVGAQPPIEVTDHRATIGPRTLLLPEGGRWYYLAQAAKEVTGGPRGQVLSSSRTAYLVQVDHGVFTLGLRLTLLKDDLWRLGWGEEPCHAPEDIYRSERGAMWQSDCVRINGRRADFDRPLGGRKGDTARWLAKEGVRTPEVSVSIVYWRYSTNTFGELSVVVPAEHFDSDAAAIAWAESLRAALKPMFEHRESEARLPPLPAPISHAGAASAPAPARSPRRQRRRLRPRLRRLTARPNGATPPLIEAPAPRQGQGRRA
jgi:hypothetical protein